MLAPPPNRAGKSDGPHEHHLYEGAVMLAYAMHLLRTEDAREVCIHPDGEHGKQFDFAGCDTGTPQMSSYTPTAITPSSSTSTACWHSVT